MKAQFPIKQLLVKSFSMHNAAVQSDIWNKMLSKFLSAGAASDRIFCLRSKSNLMTTLSGDSRDVLLKDKCYKLVSSYFNFGNSSLFVSYNDQDEQTSNFILSGSPSKKSAFSRETSLDHVMNDSCHYYCDFQTVIESTSIEILNSIELNTENELNGKSIAEYAYNRFIKEIDQNKDIAKLLFNKLFRLLLAESSAAEINVKLLDPLMKNNKLAKDFKDSCKSCFQDALKDALDNDDVNTVKKLLALDSMTNLFKEKVKRRVSIQNSYFDKEKTLLMLAIERNAEKVVQMLINAGIDVKAVKNQASEGHPNSTLISELLAKHSHDFGKRVSQNKKFRAHFAELFHVILHYEGEDVHLSDVERIKIVGRIIKALGLRSMMAEPLRIEDESIPTQANNRVLAEDVLSSDNQLIAKKSQIVDTDMIMQLEDAGVQSVKVERSGMSETQIERAYHNIRDFCINLIIFSESIDESLYYMCQSELGHNHCQHKSELYKLCYHYLSKEYTQEINSGDSVIVGEIKLTYKMSSKYDSGYVMISNSTFKNPHNENDVGPHITAFESCMDGSIKSYPHLTIEFHGDDFSTYRQDAPQYTVRNYALGLNTIEPNLMLSSQEQHSRKYNALGAKSRELTDITNTALSSKRDTKNSIQHSIAQQGSCLSDLTNVLVDENSYSCRKCSMTNIAAHMKSIAAQVAHKVLDLQQKVHSYEGCKVPTSSYIDINQQSDDWEKDMCLVMDADTQDLDENKRIELLNPKNMKEINCIQSELLERMEVLYDDMPVVGFQRSRSI